MGRGKYLIIFAAIAFLAGIWAKISSSNTYSEAFYQLFFYYFVTPSEIYFEIGPGLYPVYLNVWTALTYFASAIGKVGYYIWYH